MISAKEASRLHTDTILAQRAKEREASERRKPLVQKYLDEIADPLIRKASQDGTGSAFLFFDRNVLEKIGVEVLSNPGVLSEFQTEVRRALASNGYSHIYEGAGSLEIHVEFLP